MTSAENKRPGAWRPAGSLVLLGLLLGSSIAEARKAPAVVVLFDAIGTVDGAQLTGRVLEDKGFDHPPAKERWYRRVRRTWRLFESDELPGLKVQLEVAGQKVTVTTDKEGFFSHSLKGPLAVGTQIVMARLPLRRSHRVLGGRLQIWPKSSDQIAVLSDIDDTVLRSNVQSKAKLLWRVLISNAHQLKPIAGAPALFRRFTQGGCPVIFISGSPVNLYTRLRRFLALKRFPSAPLMLKNLGLSKGSDPLLKQVGYKLGKLEQAAAQLPGYRFVLIGDSGEKDPEIYRRFEKRHPKRVAAILIHRVTDESPRDKRFAGQLLFRTYAQAAAALEQKKILAGRPGSKAARRSAKATP